MFGDVQASPEKDLPGGRAIAMEWHKIMAPTRINQEPYGNDNIFEVIAHTRSAGWKDFCSEQLPAQRSFSNSSTIHDSEWRDLFTEKVGTACNSFLANPNSKHIKRS